MQLTVLGLILLPISLLFLNNPVRLLQLAIITSVFEAGAALLIGGFGLQPGLVPGLLFIAYIAVQYVLGMRYPGERAVLWTMAPLLLFLAYAVAGAFLLPDIFAGEVMVWPQPSKELIGLWEAMPLAPTAGNITQSLYLVLNVTAALLCALFLTRRAIPYRGILTAYLMSGYLVVLLSLWQFAHEVAGLPFPSDILYSNSGWSIVSQKFDSMPRIQGPFTEPSALGYFMSGMAFCSLWLCIRGHQIMRPLLLLALSVLTVLLSTSTTGIVVVAVGMPLVLVYAVRHGGGPGLRRALRTVVMLSIGSLVAAAPLLILRPELLDGLSFLMNMTLTKSEGDSFSERTGMDGDALQAAIDTFGLGTGWGSFRSSSLIPGVLANTGLVGLVLLVWFGVRVTRLTARAAAAAPPQSDARAAVDGFSAALCGQLVAALLSAPTIATIAFFLQLGCVVGAAARAPVEARTAQRRRPAPLAIHLAGTAPTTGPMRTEPGAAGTMGS
jgi:hypothetical protein